MIQFSNVVPFVLQLLFDIVRVVLGIAALAAASGLGPGRKGAAATGGILVLVSGILGALSHTVLMLAPAMMADMSMSPGAYSSVLGLLSGVSVFVFAGGLLALVLAATRAPQPGPHPTPGR
ncbi:MULTISPECIES: hypothetical protein [unclassified Nocardiopsis]|uniref:hypothetical protein n=1 Tax=Nocardiopsis TaxID=2013 RepID=UPI00387B8474